MMAVSGSSIVAVLFLLFLQLTSALKFDLFHGTKERCIRNFVNRDTLVVVTTTIDGYKGDGQVVNMHVCCFICRISGLGLSSWEPGIRSQRIAVASNILMVMLHRSKIP